MLSEIALKYAKVLMTVPYIWGGQSPAGVDCSGYVIMVLQVDGILPQGFDANSQGLYNHFTMRGAKPVRPYPGCLAFYGRSVTEITHVALCLDSEHVLEAGGGDSSTRTVAAARARGADVRPRKLRHRGDLVAILNTDVNKIIPLPKKD